MSKFDLMSGNKISMMPVQCQYALGMPNTVEAIRSYTDHCDGSLSLIIKELNDDGTVTYSDVNEIREELYGRMRLIHHYDQYTTCLKLNNIRILSKERLVDRAEMRSHQYGYAIDGQDRSYAIDTCTIYEHALIFQVKRALGVKL